MGELAVFLTLRRRFVRKHSLVEANLRRCAHFAQYRRRAATSVLRQSRHKIVAVLLGGANSSGHSFSEGPKKRAVSSKFIGRMD